ncbi:MAG: DUF2950 family protein, partial [Planctomycetota bacterium]
REAKAAGKLNHENIVCAHNVGEEMGLHFIVMEYCEGEPLNKMLKQEQRLPAAKAVEITVQIARGLKHAHDHGVIHRDIKPANVIVSTQGVAKILDLGLSKNIGDPQSFNTVTGATMGTAHYMSPEQARGDKTIDHRTDIYSLGATLFELLTGRPPFQGNTTGLILAHLMEPVPDPRSVQADIPEDLAHLVIKMLAKDPAQRPSDCGVLIAALEKTLETPASGEIKQIEVPAAAQSAESQQAVPRASRPPAGRRDAGGTIPSRDREGADVPLVEVRGTRQRVGQSSGLPTQPGGLRHAPGEPAARPTTKYIAIGALGLGALVLVLALLLRGGGDKSGNEAVSTVPTPSTASTASTPSIPSTSDADAAAKLKADEARQKNEAARQDEERRKADAEKRKADEARLAAEAAAKQKAEETAKTQSATPPAPPPTDVAAHAQANGMAPALSLDLGGGVNLDLVLIPAGKFMMGSPAAEKDHNNGETQHEVTISKPCYMGKYVVTVAQFERFVEAEKYQTMAEKEDLAYSYDGKKWDKVNGANWRKPGFDQGPDYPVCDVNWDDAKAFCEWLSRTCGKTVGLPTEAEWEYACRAGTRSRFCSGDNDGDLDGVAWYSGNCGTKPHHPVGQKKPNAWGLYDMHGNVFEWCQDWFDKYPPGAATDPQGAAKGIGRVVRGSCRVNPARYCRSASRAVITPDTRVDLLGFRVVVGSPRPADTPPAVAVQPETPPAPPPADVAAYAKANGLAPALSLDLGGAKMDMLLVPAGEFNMGSNDGRPDEKPVHRVQIGKPFYMGKFTVTVAQFRAFTEAAKYETDAERAGEAFTWKDGKEQGVKGINWKTPGFPQKDNFPACAISRNDALRFCNWASERTAGVPPASISAAETAAVQKWTVRLPTEAEHEYACRAGTTTKFNTGDKDSDLEETSWFQKNSGMHPNACGLKKPNAWGLYDMHGNVVDWVQDYYSDTYYAASPRVDPAGPASGAAYVVRGGAYHHPPFLCRAAVRYGVPAFLGHTAAGFRCVLAPPGTGAPAAVQPETANRKPESGSVDDPERWKHAINLLALVDPAKDAVKPLYSEKTLWARNGAEFEVNHPKWSVLEIPCRPPAEYDYKLVFTRHEGVRDIAQVLCKAGRSFKWAMAWLLDQEAPNQRFTFELVAGKVENPTTRKLKPGIENNRRYVSIVQVRNDGLKAYLDGTLISEWKTDYSDLSMWKGTPLKDETLLGVTTFGCAYTIHEAQLLEITGRATFARPDDPAAKEAKRKQDAAWAGREKTSAAMPDAGALPKELALDLGGGVNVALVLVPAGEFMMGSEDGAEEEKPIHNVKFSQPFYIGKYDVTVAQFRSFAEATQYLTDAEKSGQGYGLKDGKSQPIRGVNWRSPGFKQDDNHPVCAISWQDAQDFCKWAAKQAGRPVRLPTEAEWEYAARGPKSLNYPWGNNWEGVPANVADASLRAAGINPPWGEIQEDDGFPYTSPVGHYKNGASWCGAFDMAGNVWQWCQDYFSPKYYSESAAVDPQGPTFYGGSRVMRGASWDGGPACCRSARRGWTSPMNGGNNRGFRLAVPVQSAATPPNLAVQPPSDALRKRMAGNEIAAVRACKAYAEAQEIFHRTNYHKDGVLQYATAMKGDCSLLETKAGKGDLGIIDKSFANAEGPPSKNPIPKAGYCFKILTAQGKNAKGGAHSYVTTVNGKSHMTLGYALVAYPAKYDETGRDCFIINNNGTLFQKDLGKETPAIVEKMTEFDPDTSKNGGWTPAD